MWWPVVHASFLLTETIPSIFLACRYLQGDFMVFILPGGFDSLQLIAWNTFSSLSLWNSKSHSLLITMKEIDTLTAAHSHSHVLFWLPEVLLMQFHYQVILIPLVALLSNSESCHWHWWVISFFAWPFLDRSSTVALVPARFGGRGEGTASTLENSSILFSVYGVASNTIVSCSLFLLLCHKTFWRFCRVIPAKETTSELHLPTIQTFWWIVREMRKQWVEGQQKDNRAVSGILWQSLSGWCSAARCYNGWSTRMRNRLPIPGTWNGILYDKNLCKLIRN